jgi:hypothetical protein
MTHRDNSVFTMMAAAVTLGCAWPDPSVAQSVSTLPDGPIQCGAFQRGANGSWTVLRPAAIYPQGVALNLAPGQTFASNQVVDGFEVTAILDRNCGNR